MVNYRCDTVQYVAVRWEFISASKRNSKTIFPISWQAVPAAVAAWASWHRNTAYNASENIVIMDG